MSTDIETVRQRGQGVEVAPMSSEKTGDISTVEHAGDDMNDEAKFKAEAMEAETAEHDMTVLQAVKAYPMACLWAFIMSSTIVGLEENGVGYCL